MKMPEQNMPTPNKENVPQRSLERVNDILNKDAHMACSIFGKTLILHGIYKNEDLSLEAKKKLENLGFSPEINGRRLKIEENLSEEELEIARQVFKVE